jgi:hypothetical protein
VWVIAPFLFEETMGLSSLVGQCYMNVFLALNTIIVVCPHLVHLIPLSEKGGGLNSFNLKD